VFAVLLDSRRLTDFLPKPGVRGETDYAPVSTAGGWFVIVVSALIRPIHRPSLRRVRRSGVATPFGSAWLHAVARVYAVARKVETGLLNAYRSLVRDHAVRRSWLGLRVAVR
jgi:hypothetical protein